MRYTVACKRCHFRAHTTSLVNLGSQLHAHAGGGCDGEPSIVPEEEDSSSYDCVSRDTIGCALRDKPPAQEVVVDEILDSLHHVLPDLVREHLH